METRNTLLRGGAASLAKMWVLHKSSVRDRNYAYNRVVGQLCVLLVRWQTVYSYFSLCLSIYLVARLTLLYTRIAVLLVHTRYCIFYMRNKHD